MLRFRHFQLDANANPQQSQFFDSARTAKSYLIPVHSEFCSLFLCKILANFLQILVIVHCTASNLQLLAELMGHCHEKSGYN
jgi:hypothetical protein